MAQEDVLKRISEITQGVEEQDPLLKQTDDLRRFTELEDSLLSTQKVAEDEQNFQISLGDDALNLQTEPSFADVPRRFIEELGQFAEGLGGLITLTGRAGLSFARDVGSLLGISEPGGFFETSIDLITNRKGTRSKFVDTFLVPVRDQIVDEFGELFSEPLTAFKRRPLTQFLNVASVLTGVGAVARGVGFVGKASHIGRLASVADTVTSAGKLLSKVGNKIDPLNLAIRTAGRAIDPAVKSAKRFFFVERVLSKQSKDFLKQRNININQIADKLGDLSDVELEAMQPVIEGLAKITDEGRIVPVLDELAKDISGTSLAVAPSPQFVEALKFLKQLGKEEADFLGVTARQAEQVAFQPLAIALGKVTRNDLIAGAQLSDGLIKELGEASSPFYFPHLWETKETLKDFMTPRFLKAAAPFTKKRLGKQGYIKNSLVAFSRHRAQFARYQSYSKALTELTEGGLEQGFVKPLNTLSDLEPGFIAFSPTAEIKKLAVEASVSEETIGRMLQGMDINEAMGHGMARGLDDFSKQGADNGARMFQIDRRVAEKITKNQGQMANYFTQVFDSATNGWRRMVLNLSPRWVLYNTLGNFMLNTMAGVGPLAYMRSMPKFMNDMLGEKAPEWLKKSGKALDEVLPEEVSFGFLAEQNPEILARLGKGADTLLKQESLPLKAANLLPKINSNIETFFRTANYLSAAGAIQRKKAFRDIASKFVKIGRDSEELAFPEKLAKMSAKEVDQAVGRVNEFLFDYSNMLPFEKNVLRRLMPFWSWYKNIGWFTMSFPFKHPKRAFIMQKLAQIGQDSLRTEDVPEWMHQSFQVWINDKGDSMFMNVRGANPFSDVLEFGLSNFSPYLKIGLEQLTGRDFFRKRAFTSPDTFTIPGQEGRFRVNEVSGEPERAIVRPNIVQHFLRNTPQFEFAEDLMLPGSKYDTSTFWNPQPRESRNLQKATKNRRKIDTIRKKLTISPSEALRNAKRIRQLEDETAELEGKASTIRFFDPGSFSFKETKVDFAKSRFLEAAKLFGLSISPVDVNDQRERNFNKKMGALSAKIKILERTDPESAEVLRSFLNELKKARKKAQ